MEDRASASILTRARRFSALHRAPRTGFFANRNFAPDNRSFSAPTATYVITLSPGAAPDPFFRNAAPMRATTSSRGAQSMQTAPAMLLQIDVRAAYQLPLDAFILLMIEPPLVGDAHRVMDENLATTPTPSTQLWNDLYGNPQRRFAAPAGRFEFEFSAKIEAQPNLALPDAARECLPSEIPAECMIYTVPSRYCQSDRLQRLALSEFGALAMGGARVNAIADWVRNRVEYRYGTTDSMTDALDTATSRVGVCRDFAHLLISFCRALGIPARYVSGYCLGLQPPDFHAYAQVWLGDAWHNIDATFGGVRPALVPIAVGRDAADVAITTLFGANEFVSQSVEVREIAG